LETMQSSNRVLLVIAGSFASVGFVAMLLMAFLQWRTVNRLAQLPSTLTHKELGSGDAPSVSVGPAEQSSLRLLGAVEQLEKRLLQLEHTTHAPLSDAAHGPEANGSKGQAENGGSPGERGAEVDSGGRSAESERIMLLLGKGQSMLNLDDGHAAVSCFDEALALEPHNAEAWVSKGTALDRLQQLDQAIECYDRAIEADQSLTIAYLHKGGLFNRLERFNEALECYEKALRTQEKRQAGLTKEMTSAGQ